MSLAAVPSKHRRETFQSTGTVLESGPDTIRVETDFGEIAARRAFGCWVEPEPGDHVLVAGDLGSDLYVLSVLERPGNGPARIVPDGDLVLALKAGKLTLVAAHGIELASAGTVAVDAPQLNVRSRRAEVFFGHLSYLGRHLAAQLEKAKLVAGFFDSIVERVSLRAKRSYKHVEETDEVRAGHLSYRAKTILDLRGKNALVTAEDLVKVDAEQIHLG